MCELTGARLSHSSADWFTDSPLDRFANSYVQYLTERGHTAGTINAYLKCVAHFAHWIA